MLGICPTSQRQFPSGEGRRRAAIKRVYIPTNAAARSGRSRCHLHAGRLGGERPESRSGQISAAVVFGQLRNLSSQRARSRQRALPCRTVPVPAGALRDQLEYGGRARFVSGLGRHKARSPTAVDEAATSCRAASAQNSAVRAQELRQSGNYRSPERFNDTGSLTPARPLWRPSGSGRRQGG
jgi:hypothetical protein